MTTTMREKAIEAAAHAMYDANDIKAPWDDAEVWHAVYIKRAAAGFDAILDTLREPDRKALAAGEAAATQDADWSDPNADGSGRLSVDGVVDIRKSFTAMIDSIKGAR